MHAISEIRSSAASAHGNCINLPLSGHGSTEGEPEPRQRSPAAALLLADRGEANVVEPWIQQRKRADQATLIFHRQLVFQMDTIFAYTRHIHNLFYFKLAACTSHVNLEFALRPRRCCFRPPRHDPHHAATPD
jgi:hypothetical protein